MTTPPNRNADADADDTRRTAPSPSDTQPDDTDAGVTRARPTHAWKLFGFHITVARVAMLAVSALALTGLFRLAERVQNARVAVATVVCTALYPVFFAQSTLAHLDMAVAALTLWALVFYLPPREGEPDKGVIRRPNARR